MTRDEFHAQFRRLVGLRFAPALLDSHWEGLSDLPLDVLTEAIGLALKTRSEFPTPYELRQDADAVAGRLRAQAAIPEEDRRTILAEPVEFVVPHVANPVRVTAEWRYDCEVCSDGGWRTFWCGPDRRQPWIREAACDRRKAHGSHEWADVCPCAETNPTIIRRKAAQVKYAAQRETKASR